MEKKREQFLDLVVYEVYLRSFKDGDGDGLGDLKGLREKLDHFQELGVNALWLTPCYKSPDADNGYDVADYCSIDEKYGTLKEWKELVDDMHARGMKMIMDLVVNHTSIEHEWFKAARTSRDNPYHDYYMWADTPKTDWRACFGGGVWEYNPPTNEYYLHLFAKEQPDLNWENPKVREEVRKIVDFWIDNGVDGFRCDVLDHISKDFEKGIFVNGPRLHEYLKELFDREKTRDIFIVGECASNKNTIEDICGEGRGELTCVFQFDQIHLGRLDKWTNAPFKMAELRDIMVSWQEFCEENNLLYTLFTDNHDQPRFADRLCRNREFYYETATCIAATVFLLKGIPFLYQGQEFGMLNDERKRVEEFNDPETWGVYQENVGKMDEKELLQKLNYGSRDNARCPVAWTGDEESGYGFGSIRPWYPFNAHADKVNLQKDKSSKKSIFRFYQAIFALRKEFAVLRQGAFKNLTKEADSFVYERRLGDERILVVCNYENAQTLSLPNGEKNLLLTNNEQRRGDEGAFLPFEVAVFQIK